MYFSGAKQAYFGVQPGFFKVTIILNGCKNGLNGQFVQLPNFNALRF
jgi:hypothetical protein